MPKCPHNRVKYICKECGGSSICPHNRRKTRCYECGGGSICHHNRRKSRCKECLANKNNKYTKEEYEIISFLTKK